MVTGRILAAAALLLAAIPATVQAACTDASRACLVQAATAYLDALAGSDPATVPLAPDVRQTEQGRVTAEGAAAVRAQLAAQPTIADRADDRFFVDEKTGDVVVFTLLKAAGQDKPRRPPATLHLAQRFRVRDGLITQVEAIFERQEGTQDGVSNWPSPTTAGPPQPGSVKPDCADNTRACMTAAAKAYFDGIVAKAAGRVPFAANVRRTLGAQILEGEAALRHFLDHEEPPMSGHASRYYVDEAQHAVIVFTVIGITGLPGGGGPIVSRVADRLRVENGYILEIEGMVHGEPGANPKPLWTE